MNTTADMTYDDALAVFLDRDSSYAGGLSNHGPMAAEALVHLGVEHWLGPFVAHYDERLEGSRRTIAPAPADWRPWLAAQIDPLVDHASNLAGHGLLRVAHAVRGLERAEDERAASDTQLHELAVAVHYWGSGGKGVAGPTTLNGSLRAAEWLATFGRLTANERSEGMLTITLATAAEQPGFADRVAALAPAADPTDTLDALGVAAAAAFRRNTATNAFALLHGATVSAMASVLLPHLSDVSARRLEASVATFVAAAIVGFDDAGPEADGLTIENTADLAERAGASKEDHTIKFTDACVSLAERSGDDSPLIAAAQQIERPYGL